MAWSLPPSCACWSPRGGCRTLGGAAAPGGGTWSCAGATRPRAAPAAPPNSRATMPPAMAAAAGSSRRGAGATSRPRHPARTATGTAAPGLAGDDDDAARRSGSAWYRSWSRPLPRR
uniref:Uncharacterized protein n=1 Tax=Arundo donax TaxID=35708 RepID=A0A0A9BIN3_ARUDO